LRRGKREIIRYLAIASIIILFAGWIQISPVAAQDEKTVSIEYNGEDIEFNEEYGFPFIDENNRTQVPFRLTMESIGAEVSWNQEDYIATAIKDDVRVDVPIGEAYILRNGEKILNDTTSRVINSRTYLPIRIVLEAFGSDVKWDQESFTVVVSYEEEENLFTRIPEKYDLRDKGKVSPVKDQLTTGACWAFASLGAIESVLLPEESWDFSEDNLSLGHGFNLDQAEGGNYAISLSYLTRWSGPVREEDDPFNDGINNPNAKVVKHIQEARFIQDKDYTGIKVDVMTYGGVQSSIYLDEETLDPDSYYYNEETSSYYYFGDHIINHDIVIVGWDDHYSKENFKISPEHDGAFIAKNSYGESFGEDGYFYISYEDLHIGTYNVVFTGIEEPDNYDKIYQTDKLGYIGQIGYGEDTAYFANVYTTSGDEILEAVSFYATDQNTTYEVYVIKTFTDKKDFNKMELAARGSFDYGGYYTVKLENPVKLNGTYAVAVKIITQNSLYPVAAEFMKDEPWLNTVDTSDGIGYMSYDGSAWDRSEEVLEANVCLKAFTDTPEESPGTLQEDSSFKEQEPGETNVEGDTPADKPEDSSIDAPADKPEDSSLDAPVDKPEDSPIDTVSP